MTDRVDFYVLPGAAARDRWLFACRLAEKAYLRNLKVVVITGNAADTAGLDDLLWTFNENSFVPHRICSDETDADPATPVHLTFNAKTAPHADLLVNLGDGVPGDLERFGRVAEIVDADADRRRLGRERFKTYRELKLPLETHRMNESADS
jgi:DNA polymerase-3 subunit chi